MGRLEGECVEEALRQKKAGIRVGLGKEGLLEAGGDGCVIGEFQNGGEQFGGGFGFGASGAAAGFGGTAGAFFASRARRFSRW